jgi:hypothetical protein
MTCIGYDHEFARHFTEHFKDNNTKPTKKSGKQPTAIRRRHTSVDSASESLSYNVQRQVRPKRKHQRLRILEDDGEDDDGSEYKDGG